MSKVEIDGYDVVFYREDLGTFEITLGSAFAGVIRLEMVARDGMEYAGFSRVVGVRFCDDMIEALKKARQALSNNGGKSDE